MPIKVYPKKVLDPKIAFIGEALGKEEEDNLKYFCGEAGDLFNSCLRAAGILRSDIHLTNVVKERPPGNKISMFCEIKKVKINQTQAFLDYVQELKEELEALPSLNVLVPMGRVALWAVCGIHEITKWRGSIIESSLLPGKKVIPTFHPASALGVMSTRGYRRDPGASRQFLNRYYIMTDFEKAKAEASFPERRLLKRELRIRPTLEDIRRYIERIKLRGRTGADIECSSANTVTAISFSLGPDDAMSIPFFENYQRYWSEDDEVEIWRIIAEILEDPKVVKVWHNGNFDKQVLARAIGMNVNVSLDTQMAMHLLYPQLKKSLATVLSIYIDQPYYKDDAGDKDKRFIKIDSDAYEDFWKYSARDACCPDEAIDGLLKDLKEEGPEWERTYQQMLDLVNGPLAYMQHRGIRVDVNDMANVRNTMAKQMERLQEDFARITGYPDININSPKQLANYFYIIKGAKTPKRWGATSEKALHSLEKKGFKEAGVLLEYRHAKKLKGTYLDTILDSDNRLRCTLSADRTIWSRLASAKTVFGTGTNMQNLPDEYRYFLRPDDGYIFVSQDLSQADDRCVVYDAEEITSILAYENGEDPYIAFARTIWSGQDPYVMRKLAKKSKHSFNYRIGPRTFADDAGIPFKEASEILKVCRTRMPAIPIWWGSCERELQENKRIVKDLTGRPVRILSEMIDDTYRKCYSLKGQCTVGSVINEAMLKIYDDDSESTYGLQMLMQIHDEILYQFPFPVVEDDFVARSEYTELLAKVLIKLDKLMHRPIEIHDRTFAIPSGFKVGYRWNSTMVEVDVNGKTVRGLADELSRAYSQIRATDPLQDMGRD